MTRTPYWRALATGLAVAAALAGTTLAPGADAHALRTADRPIAERTTSVIAPAPAQSRDEHEVYEYADGLELDAYLRDVPDSPWIMYLHGGAWMEGDRDDATVWPEVWRRAGFAVFSIDYHLAGQAVWPAQVDDVDAAVDWVRANADSLGIDPERGVVVGTSAGGHIALSAGTAGLAVRGIVAISPAVDLYALWTAVQRSSSIMTHRLADGAVLLMGCSPYAPGSTCWSDWKTASPVTRISEGDAPMLILHARNDKVLPSGPVGKFCKGAPAKHVSCKVVIYPGERHGLSLMGTKSGVILDWIIAKTA